MMDVRTLKTFQRIVKYGNFSRAAEELNYAQSTVTMQIQKLEKDLGVELLARGKVVQLTDAGRMFYEQSVEIVQRIEQLQVNIGNLQIGEAGSVRIGVTEPTASSRLPNLLKRFTDQYPQIRVSLDISSTAQLVEHLLNGDIDFAICTVPGVDPELYFQPLFHEEFVVLLPEDHPLAKQKVIQPNDLQGHRLLITSTTCPYRNKLEMFLQEAGSISVQTMEIGSMAALKYYVESGLGIALVPKIIVSSIPAGTTIRSMSGANIDMLSGMLYRTSDYPLKFASAKLYRYLEYELGSPERLIKLD